MIDEALRLLLEASAHEILSRPSWAFGATPAQRAAAAAYLEYRRSFEQQAMMVAAVAGPLIGILGMWRRVAAA